MSGSDDPDGDRTPGEQRQPRGGHDRSQSNVGNRGQQQSQGSQSQVQGQGGYQSQPQQGYQQGGQYRYQQGASTFGPEFAKFGKFALGVHLTYGLGTALTIFLFFTLAPQTTTQSLPLGGAGAGGATLFASVLVAFVFGIFLSALPVIGVGVFVGRTASGSGSPALVSAAVNAGALVVTMLVLFVLALVFAPSGGAGGAGQLIGPVVGVAIAAAIVGGAAGLLGERVGSW
jgi:hypothetical protein